MEHTSLNLPPLNIPVILGSVRRGRRSEAAARFLAERVAAAGQRTLTVDLRELGLPMYDEEAATEGHTGVAVFRQAIADADAVVVLTPEYNHAYTAAVKNALDFLHLELRRKPVAVCGLSGGEIGGARAVEQLKLVLIEFHAVPIRESVYFANAGRLFDADGQIQRPDLIDRADYMIADLIWYAQALKWGRAHLPIPQRKPKA